VKYGFVVDYLAEILRFLRNHDYSHYYQDDFTLSSDLSTRDRDGINKTFSGLMKVIFPHGEATAEEKEELLRCAIEGRKRVKDQLLRIDSTYSAVNFSYQDQEGNLKKVTTLEEEEYASYYYQSVKPKQQEELTNNSSELQEQHLIFQENQRGVSFDDLFGAYLKGVHKLTITDPYIRLFYQVRNLMEFLETVVKHKTNEDEVTVHLITIQDEWEASQQTEYLEQVAQSCLSVGINFTWEFDRTETIHARHIITDRGWKIILDRGLDIFQQYDMNNAFVFANRLQQFRSCKAFEITYVKNQES
jgi:ATP-dependent Lon protease